MAEEKSVKSLFAQVNKAIFLPPAILLVIAVILGAVWPQEFNNIGNIILNYMTKVCK